MNLLRSLLASLIVFSFAGASSQSVIAQGYGGVRRPMSPHIESAKYGSLDQNAQSSGHVYDGRVETQAQQRPNQYSHGGRQGGESIQNQAQKVKSGKSVYEATCDYYTKMNPRKWAWETPRDKAQGEDSRHMGLWRPEIDISVPGKQFAGGAGSNVDTAMLGSPYDNIADSAPTPIDVATAAPYGSASDSVASLNRSGGGGALPPGSGVNSSSSTSSGSGGGMPDTDGMFEGIGKMFKREARPTQTGAPVKSGNASTTAMRAQTTSKSFNQHPEMGRNKEKANNNAQQGSRGSSAGESAKENELACFESYMEYLINVANEEAGAACSSRAASKTYANVVYMVQEMYKRCYVPMAILFLLPGALITQTKTLVKKGFMPEPKMPDPDTLSPFVGIARAMVAIFLIPATQLAVSYCIDIGNSLEDCCRPHISIPLIQMWCEEQIQILDPKQQGGPIKNIPNMPQAAYRGKFAGMPVKGAILEQMSGLDLALMELVNECYHMLTLGLCIISAFQLVMMCYLFLIGPIAAAFFAWPQLGRSLFRQAFSVWLDAVVVLSLWKFWWNVTLVCMTVRLQSGAVDPFNPFEVYYLIAFFCILMVMPFNPFDFHGSALVGFIESKAAGVVGKVAQGGKSSGGGGGGKGGAKGHSPKSARVTGS